MLYSVPGDGPHRDGGICKERPRRPDHVAAALAVLCGRPLPAVARQFAPNDTPAARRDLKRSCMQRCPELTQLEAALARMTDEEQRKHRAAATAAAATAAAAAAAAATAPTAGQRRPREEESEEEEDLEPGLVLSKTEFQRLLAIDRARRNPARLLFDHARPKGLVISICDADFTYFEWGAPEDEDDEDTTPTRWYAEVRSATSASPPPHLHLTSTPPPPHLHPTSTSPPPHLRGAVAGAPPPHLRGAVAGALYPHTLTLPSHPHSTLTPSLYPHTLTLPSL